MISVICVQFRRHVEHIVKSLASMYLGCRISNLYTKATCEVVFHTSIHFPTISPHMESNTLDIREASIRKDKNPSIKDDHHTYTSFSDPEDDTSSSVESFDEDDMYGSDNEDEFLGDSPDLDGARDGEPWAPSMGMVCPLPHLKSPCVSCLT